MGEKGNKYWQLADPANFGKPRNFETPEILLQKAYEYFQWVDENPIKTTKTTVSDKGTYTNTDILQRPYTWEGLYVYLDVCNLEYYKKLDDYSNVITRINNVMRSQKFEGASVGIFNSNIIARDLGLKENVDNTTNGKDLNTPILSFFKSENEDK